MYQCCVEAYEGNEERVIENARLLWLRRYDDEPLWIPPERIDDDSTTSSKQSTTSE